MSALTLKIAGLVKGIEEEQSIGEQLQPFIHKFPDLTKEFKFLADTFVRGKEFEHPRDIYPVYSTLNMLSDTLGQTDEKEIFGNFIRNSLEGFAFQRTGFGKTYFKTSSAEKILDVGLKKYTDSFEYEKLDLNIGLTRTKAIEYVQSVDSEAFGNCFKKSFLDSVFRSPDTACFACQDEQSMELKAICWGFFSTHDTHEIFHFWELSRLPSEASMQIGENLFDFAREKLTQLSPALEFMTLNVKESNSSAKQLYLKKGFTDLVSDQHKKIFMTCALKSEIEKPRLDESVKTIVQNFVIDSVPLPKLICCELARKCELLFRSYFYRWL